MKLFRLVCIVSPFARPALGIVISLATAWSTYAANKTWTSAISGQFAQGSNWTPSGAPGSTDNAAFSAAGAYTVTFSNSPNPLPNPVSNQDLFFSAGNVIFTSGAGGPYTYQLKGGGGSDANITGGTLTLGSGANPLHMSVADDLLVRNGATLNVNSGSTVSAVDLLLAQGTGAGGGAINVDGASSQLNVTGGATQSLGLNGNGGTLTYRNGSTGSFTGPLAVGVSNDAGTAGVLNVQSGAQANVASLAVGTGTTGSGTVNINGVGSTLTQSGASTLTVGAASGGTGAINIGTTTTGGTLTTGTGLFTINKTGTVSVGGGATNTATLNANGDVLIDGGLLDIVPTGNFQLAAGKTFTVQNGGEARNIQPNATNAVYNIIGTGTEWTDDLIHIENGAQVNLTSGAVLTPQVLYVDGGVFQVSDSGTFLLQDRVGGLPAEFNVLNGGRATFDYDGAVYVASNGGAGHFSFFTISGANSKWELVDETGLRVAFNTKVRVDSGGLLSVAGDLQLQELFPGDFGSLTIDGGTVTANALLIGTAAILDFKSGTLGITGAQGLTVAPSNLGTNFSLTPNRTLNVTNTTTIPVGASLTLGGGTLNTSNLLINGTFNFDRGTLGITGPAGLTVGAGGLLGSTLVLNNNQTLNVTNIVTVNSGAFLDVAGGFSAGNLVNNGDLVVINTDIDAPVVNNHAVTVVGSVDFNGLVSGPGNFFGPGTAHFNGGMAPGASPANVSFEGNLALADTNTLFIEISGITPGSQYDRLTVDGGATVDGMLNVSLINGFMPAPGQQFTILTAGSITNNGFVLAGTAASSFSLLVNSTSVILQAIGLPGDFNHDNKVDAADYVVWRKGLGTTYTQNDYAIWRAHFGETAGSGAGATASAAVPEPATLTFMSLAAACGYLRRRRAA